MITKKEIMIRLCDVESSIEINYDKLKKLEKRVKALEPKKEKKTK